MRTVRSQKKLKELDTLKELERVQSESSAKEGRLLGGALLHR